MNPNTTAAPACPLCQKPGGLLIAQTEQLRIIRVQGAEAEAFPAFYRVVWNAHVAEWTDLVPLERSQLMQTVAKVETVLRQALQPTKVNLASLGNLVSHLHWHVVARFDWDNRFPAPIWAPSVRENDKARLDALRDRLPDCDATIASLPF